MDSYRIMAANAITYLIFKTNRSSSKNIENALLKPTFPHTFFIPLVKDGP